MIKQSGRLFIVGAGFAGISIATEVREKQSGPPIAAFIDDDRDKIGTEIMGVPVLGPIRQSTKLLRTNANDEVLIAIPSASRARLRTIYKQLEIVGFRRIRIVPALSQIVGNGVHLALTRDINPDDLLGRTQNRIELGSSLRYAQGKRVLITGAGGSIGSELARLLLYGGVERLYLLGHGENSIYEINSELRLLQREKVGVQTDIVPIIGELQDGEYVDYIFQQLKADIVFHTAAHKHVPMAEQNPVSVAANNIFGTLNVVESASRHGVKKLTCISTDKAVDPLGVYGVSKHIAEQIALSYNGIVVRFGNVLGSRGSIIPLFQRQIEHGGPVTVTTPTVKRYFMTISEAAALVLKACGVGSRGELYLLNMGDTIAIKEIAEQLIGLYGYRANKDIDIVYTGLRKGEKEQERLYGVNEELSREYAEGIQQIRYAPIADKKLKKTLDALRPICYLDSKRKEVYRDPIALREALSVYCPTLEYNDVPSEVGAESGAESGAEKKSGRASARGARRKPPTVKTAASPSRAERGRQNPAVAGG